MKDFILDFRPKLEKLHPFTEEESTALLSLEMEEKYKGWLSNKLDNRLSIHGSSDKNPLLEFDDLSEDDVIYCDCFNKYHDFLGYYKAVIKHKYWDHLFLIWLEGPLEGKRLVIQNGSFLSMHGLYPIKVIGSHPWKLSCENPKVEFIYD